MSSFPDYEVIVKLPNGPPVVMSAHDLYIRDDGALVIRDRDIPIAAFVYGAWVSFTARLPPQDEVGHPSAPVAASIEVETQEIQDAVKAVGGGGPVPVSQRIYNLVRLMIDDRNCQATR